MKTTALTQADAVVLNAAALLTHMVVFDGDRQKLLLGVLREAVNRANWDNPRMGPLLDAVRLLLDRGPTPDRSVRQHYAAEVRGIETAVEDLLWWRLGHAQEKFRETQRAVA